MRYTRLTATHDSPFAQGSVHAYLLHGEVPTLVDGDTGEILWANSVIVKDEDFEGKGLDKMVKTAPAGSEVGIATLKSAIAAVNASYENLSKVAKQFTEVTQSNFEAVAKQAAEGVKKAGKKAA